MGTVIMARKPIDTTVAENVLKYGTGGLNIGISRITHNEILKTTTRQPKSGAVFNEGSCGFDNTKCNMASANPSGRWPANLLLDEESAAILDEQSGITISTGGKHSGRKGKRDVVGKYGFDRQEISRQHDEGGASRFYYTAKASQSERNCGTIDNDHPTVKPVDLMEYLCKLVTPIDGLILDMFAGSGSTCIAARNCKMNYIGIENKPEYVKIANNRINRGCKTLDSFEEQKINAIVGD
jgi:site-specific DNA-methyltransferase (adenine-specific)